MSYITSIIPGAFGLIGVLLGVWLSSRNSSREKLIDLRRKTYGSILYHMSKVESAIDVQDEYISEAGWESYFQSDAEMRLSGQISEHMALVRDRVSEDYLVLSDEFRSIYEKFMTESVSPTDVPYYEHDESFDVALRKCRPLLLSRARQEVLN